MDQKSKLAGRQQQQTVTVPHQVTYLYVATAVVVLTADGVPLASILEASDGGGAVVTEKLTGELEPAAPRFSSDLTVRTTARASRTKR